MNDINIVSIIGRLTGEPKMVVDTDELKIVSFAIANNRKVGKEKEAVSFINCQAFGHLASVIVQYCSKGDRVAIHGRLQQKTWQKKDGTKASDVTIMLNEIQFLSGNKRGQKEKQEDFENLSNASEFFGDVNF